ncbi:MAG: cytochrome c family protein [Armatimonadota bacterium]|nr:cytochrome c family protein [Armatimonadota bacterium]
MMQYRRGAWGAAAALWMLLLGVSGCGKGLSTGGGPHNVDRVSVAPITDGTVRAGETERFIALATTATGQTVLSDFAWSVEPPSLGRIAGQGAEALFTAGTPGTGKVVAVASNGVRGEFPVTVVAGPIADLRVEPIGGKTTIEAGDTETFRVTGYDLGGNEVGQSRARVVLSPVWSVTGGIGTITQAGVFTAAAAGVGKTGQIVATVDNVQGTLNVTVVQGSRALFVGSEVCGSCHSRTHEGVMQTRHWRALELLKTEGRAADPTCLPCHTVGYGRGGFVSEEVTPGLAGVQCESCHGPGSEHVAANGDAAKILSGTAVLSATVCGTCHTNVQHPTYGAAHNPSYDEWHASRHAEVSEEVAVSMESQGEARMKACGPCHSGSVRTALRQNRPLPNGHDAATVGITCTVCHGPHRPTGNPAQLRNPLASLTPFSYNTAATTSFAAQYDANINLCGQCHNMRGAVWNSTARPPHHSPQYNMLIGNGGVEEGVVAQSAHRAMETQCTHCHVYNGDHLFIARLQACRPCHTEADAGARQAATQADIQQRIASVKSRLDRWATTMAPAALRNKYGALAWEYTVPGSLSNPSGDPAVVGPSSAEQTPANVPDAIKQARHNVYLVLYDASFGVHNAKYARSLLETAHAKLDSLNVPR